MRKAGKEVDPQDLPPALEWEEPAWNLYERIMTQWRAGPVGRTSLDYGIAISMAERKGFNVELTLELLQVVEIETLSWDAQARERKR